MKKAFEFPIFVLILFVFSLPALAQSNQQIEKELAGHINNIEQWSNSRTDALGEKIISENDTFEQKLLKYTKQPSTLTYSFSELAKIMYIATSEDGKFRIYTWDTEGGGTMHFFKAVYQFQGADGKVYSKSQELGEGDPGGFVYDIFTVDTPTGKVYMGCSNSILSTSEAAQSISLFTIKNNALNDKIKLIKTTSGLNNSLGFEYDFFSVVDHEERPVKLIHYDKSSQSIKIPVVLKDQKFQYGKVTNKVIVYKFNGQYFVKIS